ncbi:MAG: hypothetical protein ACR2OR_05980 [Hyphomicrobiales bacterium]
MTNAIAAAAARTDGRERVSDIGRRIERMEMNCFRRRRTAYGCWLYGLPVTPTRHRRWENPNS